MFTDLSQAGRVVMILGPDHGKPAEGTPGSAGVPPACLLAFSTAAGERLGARDSWFGKAILYDQLTDCPGAFG
jgi:hypothetical protein